MSESPLVLAEMVSESVVMTQGNGVHALPNSWRQITPRAITGINRAGQRRYWRNSDGLCDQAASDP
jgi:hypothetical protein